LGAFLLFACPTLRTAAIIDATVAATAAPPRHHRQHHRLSSIFMSRFSQEGKGKAATVTEACKLI